MRIVTNEAYIAKRKNWGSRIALLSFVFLIAGGIYSFLDPTMSVLPTGLPSEANLIIAYVLVIIGFIGFNLGTYHARRWGRPDREDLVLKEGLSSLDNRYRLYNYVAGLPVLHVLLTPQAVYALETRGIDGQTVICEGDRWRRHMKLLDRLRALSEERLKNPTNSALGAAAHLQAYLQEHVSEKVPVKAVVVFTGKEINLSVTDPVVPAVLAKNLRSVIRSQDEPMPPTAYRAVAQHLIDTAGDLEEDEVAPAPLTRQPGSRQRHKKRRRS
ncbi:MAG: NERD domain-containing protein [Chloroflexi bacterium]|nr:NERD domain-containing protein [Chloroflexota bacterium]MBU1751353.1 NERD domain-containing protein [Chloroflexota bacterium]MBU1879075.1 NERD domain-containing protein [Chloroflexota bacterium]